LVSSPTIKILVFAHTPPPHHGQSVMVALLLDALRSDGRFEVHHVDARVSDGMADIGSFRPAKFFRLLGCVAEALRIRLKHGPMLFYHVPAPVKKSAILRDWIVMGLCRPFFPKLILHWHACGLGVWARSGGGPWRAGTRFFLCKAALSIVTTVHNRSDAEALKSRQIVVVPNGSPDPCPDFSTTLGLERPSRIHSSTKRCLFLAHCTESKGLFNALEAFARARKKAWETDRRRLDLTVAGSFVDPREERRFLDRIAAADLQHADGTCSVAAVGFLEGGEKDRAFRSHDCLLFPSRWESFGLTVVEAAAYGLPSVISEHPNLLTLLPENLRFAAPAGDAGELGDAILSALEFGNFPELRRFFLEHYQASTFASKMIEALRSV
jgi:glycosyltransferase involved in cell wall biosynthesis